MTQSEISPGDLEDVRNIMGIIFFAPDIIPYVPGYPDAPDSYLVDDFLRTQSISFQEMRQILYENLGTEFGYSSPEQLEITSAYRSAPLGHGGPVGPEHFILILGTIDELLRDHGEWISVGQIVAGALGPARTAWQRYADRRGNSEANVDPILPIGVLRSLVYAHANQEYGVLASEVVDYRIEGHDELEGVGTIKHPMGNELIRIELVLVDSSLVYWMNSRAQLTDHAEFRNGKRRSLPMSPLYDRQHELAKE